MKHTIIGLLLLLIAPLVSAQSDCSAPNCGMVPLLNFNNERGVTDLYLYYDTDCDLYFRVRFSPVEGTPPDPVFYQVPPGEERFILRGIMGHWGQYRGHGTFVIDWATYECQPVVLAAGIFREEGHPLQGCGAVFYNIAEPEQFERGCHYFYADSGTVAVLNLYNENDFGVQVVEFNDEFYIVGPGQTVRITVPWDTHFFKLCTGETPPGPSLPGLDLDLPLYIEGLSFGLDGDVHKIIHLN